MKKIATASQWHRIDAFRRPSKFVELPPVKQDGTVVARSANGVQLVSHRRLS